mmetsp:Transcript_23174/g.41394  ORF Transcript_23174/g.41394 Transcript_23174/m.41394 type:complete len:748 (-) Transcript_23174:39-2282(-)|eukprot:CAMPEP_0201664230 /NCGR_PEP_ID=MMETSP0494-20130426/5771_1 /ASSEMBLY_ACC=CAM_ASM_000839 /TAXON_ID=420259 /ORGANISM="Thalassiosira gravida, Strain GMp14c1" /LENGTH=747 /DNA_ID=CAMNT_0048142965 /DNA_START=51 /DNA_END=2294 /DNA_ORIENTATION=-
MSLSLTQKLRLCRNSCDDSILFYHHPSTSTSNIDGKQLHQQLHQQQPNSDDHCQYLTYKQCWNIVEEHQQWLETNIIRQQRSIILEDSAANTTDTSTHHHLTTTANTTRIRDVVIGYLADNSPDLLLSVLACTNISSPSSPSSPSSLGISGISEGPKVLPAMINVRWTPSEMERALRPTRHYYAASNGDTRGDGGSKDDVHVTILLYGLGYERAAEETVRRMNQPKKTRQRQHVHSDKDHGGCAIHIAVALSLPELADRRYATESVNLNFSSGIRNDDPAQSSIQQHSTNATDQTSITRDDDDDATSDDDALLLFTSGTSSPNGAKGVRLSHRSLIVQARAKTHWPCLYDDRTNVVATTVPWFHVGGMSSALAVMLAGGSLVFPASDEGSSGSAAAAKGGVRKGFRPGTVLDSIRSNENSAALSVVAANTLVVVPAMLHAIADHVRERFSTMVLTNVRLILVGGQSIGNGRLYGETRRLFPKARIVQTYACTEAGSSITFEDLGLGIEIDGDNDGCRQPSDGNTSQNDGLDGAICVGCPPPHIQIGIFDAEAPQENVARPSLLPHGTMGIIGTRGPHVMSGYWNRGGDTLPTTNPSNDGDWMLTNDLGYIHPRSRKLFFCGRANDVIRTGGESVLATEVERVIETHADVTECAVFALPDEKFGEAVCAAVVLEGTPTGAPARDGITMEDGRWAKWVRKHCAEHQLAGFKRPRRVFCVDALPRNSSGKVLKHVIIRLCAFQSKEASRL